MDENLAYWTASLQRAGKWFSSSLALGTDVVADIIARLPSDLPCYHDHARCHCSSYFLPTWWAHNPQFHRIETWLSCKSLILKYPLQLTSYVIHESSSYRWSILVSDAILILVSLDPFHTLFQASNDCLLARNFLWYLLTLLSILS